MQNHPEHKHETAIFAGGCFWCIEEAFAVITGVLGALPGYTGGKVPNPTYEQVCSGTTGHYEAVKVVYDPAEVGFPALLENFWRHIDPTDAHGQFADRGSQYHTAVFFTTEAQREHAQASIAALEAGGIGRVQTKVLPAVEFFPAEEYHREYYRKQPGRYCSYKALSGREAYIQAHGG